ncbi:MAG: hypothetical protein JWP66_554 [Naasia sp.]|nr:hypothetical protein [Naasia sp.]
MSGFRRVPGALERRFSPGEEAVLASLAADLRRLFTLGAVDDAVLARLAPSAYPDDDQAAAEFADFARPRILGDKDGAAGAVLADLEGAVDGVVRVAFDRVPLWLRTLTDLRVALHERAGEFPDEETAAILDWLGWLLAGMLDAFNPEPLDPDGQEGVAAGSP